MGFELRRTEMDTSNYWLQILRMVSSLSDHDFIVCKVEITMVVHLENCGVLSGTAYVLHMCPYGRRVT